MSLVETRLGANAPGLPGPTPLPPLPAALSRRAALFGGVAAAAVPTPGHAAALFAADARLVAMAAELRTVLADTVALIKDDHRDCEDIPGYAPLESRRMAISDALFELSPDGLAGLVALADIVQRLADQTGGAEEQAGHGHNLACDVLRIVGGRHDA